MEDIKDFIDYFEKNEDDTRKYFYTNNVCESLNRTIIVFLNIQKKLFIILNYV